MRQGHALWVTDEGSDDVTRGQGGLNDEPSCRPRCTKDNDLHHTLPSRGFEARSPCGVAWFVKLETSLREYSGSARVITQKAQPLSGEARRVSCFIEVELLKDFWVSGPRFGAANAARIG
jgi:hypothetical protein